MSDRVPAVTLPPTAQPTPIFDASSMSVALNAFQALQAALDAALENCVTEFTTRDGVVKRHRNASFWRAVGKAFQIECMPIVDEFVEVRGDWGYKITIHATDPAGNNAYGDGMCMSSEKSGPTKHHHFVRAQAFTRAQNRAIRNLVGFGDVSAEEFVPDADVAGEIISLDEVGRLQNMLATEGKRETDLVAYLGLDTIHSVTTDMRKKVRAWIMSPTSGAREPGS